MPKAKRIPDIDKERLYKCFSDGRDYQSLAKDLGINVRSAVTIVRTMYKRNGVASLPSGGKYFVKFDDDMREEVADIISEYPTMTIKEINATMRKRLPNKPQVTDDCVTKNLDGMLYTIKKVVNQPIARNSETNKLMRRDYVTWYLENVYNSRAVFIDEAGCNLWTHRSRGRSKIGYPAVRVTCGQRGRNLSLIMAISRDLGVVHSSFHFGGITMEKIQSFIQELSEKLHNVNNVYFIMDNSPCHNVVSNNPQHKIKKLPPYSPPLNPIEESFSCWKFALKAALNIQQNRIMDTLSAEAAGKNMAQWRGDILREVANECLDVITPEKCASWHSHMIKMLAKCNQLEDI